MMTIFPAKFSGSWMPCVMSRLSGRLMSNWLMFDWFTGFATGTMLYAASSAEPSREEAASARESAISAVASVPGMSLCRVTSKAWRAMVSARCTCPASSAASAP